MSNILKMTTGVLMLGLAVAGVAQARAINHNHPHLGFAGPVYTSSDARGGGFAWSAQHRDGYDGGGYWWGGDC